MSYFSKYLQYIGTLSPHHVCMVGSVLHLLHHTEEETKVEGKCVSKMIHYPVVGSYLGSQNKDGREWNSKTLKALPGKVAGP